MRDELAAVARLDLAEVLRSRWLLFCVLVYGALSATFVLVGLRESTVYGFTGMGRVILSFCHALVLLLPLLALTATGQVINRARDDGTLELLFSHPLGRARYFFTVAAVRYLALLLPLLLLLLLLSIAGRVVFSQPIPWAFLGRAAAVSAGLLLAFVGLGLLLSTAVRNQQRAMIYVLLAWALGVALLDFALVGLLLRYRVSAAALFLLSALNPVQAARMALLSAAQPELGVLGPVGFYLSTRVGPQALFALGTLWPALFGLCGLLLAARAFRRGDLV